MQQICNLTDMPQYNLCSTHICYMICTLLIFLAYIILRQRFVIHSQEITCTMQFLFQAATMVAIYQLYTIICMYLPTCVIQIRLYKHMQYMPYVPDATLLWKER